MNIKETLLTIAYLKQNKPIKNLAELVKEIDSVLVEYGIKEKFINKKILSADNSDFIRSERRINITPDIITIEINKQLNQLAKKYGGKAIGSENIKKNLVTIDLVFDNEIYHSIILKTIENNLPKRIGKKSKK